jgi:hypothetical protein
MRPLLFVLALLAVPGCGHAAAQPRNTPSPAAGEMRALLAELIAVDTSNPPGNEAAAAQVAARWLREAASSPSSPSPPPDAPTCSRG